MITAGEVDVATLYNGTYDLYAWGASGSPADAKNMKVKGDYLVCNNHGGTGAYVRGTLKLSEPKNVFVYVGESGKSTGTSYNGGGAGSEHKDVEKRGMSGGGATDFCVGVDNHCNDMKQHYQERILVAGGGGGGHSPDTCWSKDSTELACGGDAKAILRDGLPWIDFRASSGWSRSGIAWEGKYLAPPGQDKQNYRIHSSYNPKNQPLYAKHEELFGVGQDAVKDAEIDPLFKCSSEGGWANDNAFWRHGGGGGGWYGGMSANWSCQKSIGGGAGSSYAFVGTRHGQGAQDEKYALTEVGGRSPYEGPVPRLSIDDNHLITGLELLDKEVGLSCNDYPCYGNIGHGYALIRARRE